MKPIRKTEWYSAVALTLACGTAAQAQPDVRQGGLADNPEGARPLVKPQPREGAEKAALKAAEKERAAREGAAREGAAREGAVREGKGVPEGAAREGERPFVDKRVFGGGDRLQNWGEAARNMREQSVRRSLAAQGNDEKTQDAVVAHMGVVDKAKAAVSEKSDRLRPALGNRDVMADAQFNALLNEYLAAIEDYNDTRAKSEKELDAKIGYTKKPRLHATLLTMGVVGDAPQGGAAPGVTTFAFNNAAGGAGGLNMPMVNEMINRFMVGGMAGGNGGGNFGGNFGGGNFGGNFGGPPGGPNGGNFGGNFNGNPPAFDFGGGPPNNGPLFLVPNGGPNGGQPGGPNGGNNEMGAMRREFSEQIKALREEIEKLKAAQKAR